MMKEKTTGQLHAGHRKRMETRFLATDKNGDSSFEEHELLEMLLFLSIPRQNTNETAHLLLSEFGSLRGVFEAPVCALKKVPRIGDRSAFLIRLVSVLIHSYICEPNCSRPPLHLSETAEIVSYLHNLFFGYSRETVYMLLFDGSGALICTEHVSSATDTATEAVYCKTGMIRAAVLHGAEYIILAHNHPSGNGTYSKEDICTTHDLIHTFNAIGIKMLEHYIVTEHTCVGIIAEMCTPMPEQEEAT